MQYPETDREKPNKSPSLNLKSVLIKEPEATFLFRVKGDSMTGVGIYPGDMLVVDKSIDPKHNDIVIAIYNNDFTVKRLYKIGSKVKLVPENNLYPPITLKGEDELVIWGVVTNSIHKLH